MRKAEVALTLQKILDLTAPRVGDSESTIDIHNLAEYALSFLDDTQTGLERGALHEIKEILESYSHGQESLLSELQLIAERGLATPDQPLTEHSIKVLRELEVLDLFKGLEPEDQVQLGHACNIVFGRFFILHAIAKQRTLDL